MIKRNGGYPWPKSCIKKISMLTPIYPWSFKNATDYNQNSKERKPADNPIKKYVKIFQIME